MNEPVRKLDRAVVRALAEKNSAELRQVASAGGNPYQTSLDQQDKINEFAAALSDEEAVLFLNMYAEELNACTQRTTDETNQIIMENIEKNHNAEIIGGIVSTAIFIFILFAVLN